jgi:GMP synthase (glutamine-hydrolysing)
VPITPDVIEWHVDAVTRLPHGAVHLAGSPLCENQAFRVGRLAWGIQFHVETTPALLRTWAHDDIAAGLMKGYDVDRILARAATADADVIEVWRPVMERFAAIVLDPLSVKVARPIRISTAEPITDPAEIRAALGALAGELQASRAPLPWPTAETAETAEPRAGQAEPRAGQAEPRAGQAEQ